MLAFMAGMAQDLLHEADGRLAAHAVKLTFQTLPGTHGYRVWRQHDATLLFTAEKN
jgi:hypothetical protein